MIFNLCIVILIILCTLYYSTKVSVATATIVRAVYNRWTGPVDWTSGLDYWTHLLT